MLGEGKQRMRVRELFAQSLLDLNVTTMFGLMGDANMVYIGDYRDRGGQYVAAVHEGGAMGMADAYSRMSGQVGVASVTHGPAFTNTLTSLVEAVRSRSQVLLVTGSTPPEPTHFQRLDIGAVAVALGAGFDRVYSPATVTRDLARAVQRIVTERRPVVLDLPAELLELAAPDQARVVPPEAQ